MAIPIPSRSGSRSTLKNINSDVSDMDDNSIKKVRRYDGSYDTHEPLKGKPNVEFGEKKMDLDEDDITSSEGSEFKERRANDIEYRPGDPQQRQVGRRSQRLGSDYKPIEEEENSINYPPPPNDSPTPYSPNSSSPISPTFSAADRDSFENQQPSPTPKSPPGGVRVMPFPTQQPQPQRPYNYNLSQPVNSVRYTPTASPPLSQNVGLPRMDSKSTEV